MTQSTSFTDDPLSPKPLRVVISSILTGSRVPPSADKLIALSNLLIEKRAIWHVLSKLRGAASTIESTTAAIDQLRQCLMNLFPAMQIFDAVFNDFQAMINLQGVNYKLDASINPLALKADRLMTAAREARAEMFDPDGVIFQRARMMEDRFNSYAPAVAAEFISVVQASNPGLSIGLRSNKGPLPRFLSAVAPLVSSESITIDAVKSRLAKSSGETKSHTLP